MENNKQLSVMVFALAIMILSQKSISNASFMILHDKPGCSNFQGFQSTCEVCHSILDDGLYYDFFFTGVVALLFNNTGCTGRPILVLTTSVFLCYEFKYKSFQLRC
ncbi:hypothetical protein Syun_029918 [Stephania yunnanensis]|uniref:Uncharacterized protein n=1 Tax=Stephania yunnanensis TaxID=152371 RepID=A0AAP0HHQ4_9MAGN